MVLHNVSLLPYNTFRIDEVAETFTEVANEGDIQLLCGLNENIHVLGGGSNVLLKGRVPGLVVLNKLKGITVTREDEHSVYLQVASGEIWHNIVMLAVSYGWGGIENLALIPGTVGAAPIQNIGAYGVEVKDTIETVNYIDLRTGALVQLTAAECQFGYRDSIFKRELSGRVIITSVVFRLQKQPILNTTYGAIPQELAKMGVSTPTIKAVAQAVINIRTSKLPDPKVTGNAGSFFKNPTVPVATWETLKARYSSIPSYPVDDLLVKIPAGWLIEQAGWKGYKKGDAGVHPMQALVLCNYGEATGNDIWALSSQILESVRQRFGITLEREVQIWGQ